MAIELPKYKNCSGSSYMYYGVTFHPYEVHEVPGSISHPKFIVTDDPETGCITKPSENVVVESPELISTEHISETESTDIIEGTKRGRRSTKGE